MTATVIYIQNYIFCKCLCAKEDGMNSNKIAWVLSEELLSCKRHASHASEPVTSGSYVKCWKQQLYGVLQNMHMEHSLHDFWKRATREYESHRGGRLDLHTHKKKLLTAKSQKILPRVNGFGVTVVKYFLNQRTDLNKNSQT